MGVDTPVATEKKKVVKKVVKKKVVKKTTVNQDGSEMTTVTQDGGESTMTTITNEDGSVTTVVNGNNMAAITAAGDMNGAAGDVVDGNLQISLDMTSGDATETSMIQQEVVETQMTSRKLEVKKKPPPTDDKSDIETYVTEQRTLEEKKVSEATYERKRVSACANAASFVESRC